MSRYERVFGTDWDELTDDEAVERAYALGVAAALDEYHPEELEAIREAVDTQYKRSIVDLAFDEGRNEGREIQESDSKTNSAWKELIDEEFTTIEPENPVGGRTGLPEAVARMQSLDRQTLDSTGSTELPSFLERD